MNECCKQTIKDLLQSMLREEYGTMVSCMNTHGDNFELYKKAKALGVEFDPEVIEKFDLKSIAEEQNDADQI